MTLAPLQERYAVQDSSLQEKRTELDLIVTKRTKCEKAFKELESLLESQRRLVGAREGREE